MQRVTISSVVVAAWILASGEAHAAPGDFAEPDASSVWHAQGEPGSSFGWAVAELPDIDGDGVMEAMIGAPSHNEGDGPAGLLVVRSGATGRELHRFVGDPASLLGYALAAAGDVDADGVADIVGGAPGAGGTGRVIVYSGANGSVLTVADGEAPGDQFGSAVAAAGDIDGDGFADVLVGAEASDTSLGNDDAAGRAYIISGADGTRLRTIVGSEAGANFGSATGFVGDLDDDGIADSFIGARSAQGGGAAYIHSGADGAELLTLAGGSGSGSFGWFFVASPGDLDGDTIPDLFVGDFDASANGATSGRFHVFSGDGGALLFEVPGSGPSEGLGPGRGAGDVDADGVPDLVVGSYISSSGAAFAGKVTWFSGADGTELRRVTSLEPGEQLGFDAVGLGDVNGDGFIDILAAAAAGDNVYVLAGTPLGDDSASSSSGDGDDTSAGDTTEGNANDTSAGPTTTTESAATTATTTSETTTDTETSGGQDGGGGCSCTAGQRAPGLGFVFGCLLVAGCTARRRSTSLAVDRTCAGRYVA